MLQWMYFATASRRGIYFFFAIGVQLLMIWSTVSGYFLQRQHKGLLSASIVMIAHSTPGGCPVVPLKTCHE
eukprot:13080940-Ditylum_brightwellii.AAC.1